MARLTHFKIASLLAGMALVATSLGATATATATASPAHPAAPTARGVKVSLGHTSRGKVLVGPNGHSLYIFTADSRNHSHCGRTCRLTWPPLMSKRPPRAGTGVKATKLGRTTKGQVTYYGHPLYYYSRDHRAGQIRGEDLFVFNGYWYLQNARGHAVL